MQSFQNAKGPNTRIKYGTKIKASTYSKARRVSRENIFSINTE